MVPKELPNELSPLRNIDLVLGAQLPNLLTYCMNPSEHAELKRKWMSFFPKICS